jgi:hypothetical protein
MSNQLESDEGCEWGKADWWHEGGGMLTGKGTGTRMERCRSLRWELS